ncbi:DUF4118 domain-containing protein [Rhodoferax sp. AJA081-3]|uniref:DUF4118 domain-containing protein n=1 Tax=Rhodoferax sp. AJA081-3 TaxID=2752316 RepID=UPI001AE09425|nr:DUF4118 domain-containing protein [Rhodoferax sp. AJA081-3]QTN26215.1 DUF4118 domain-containing protein [Rhodoferax sp. AJA081-3]
MRANPTDDLAHCNARKTAAAGLASGVLSRWASPVQRYGWVYALLVVLMCTGLCALMTPYFDLANLIMVYLAGVVYTALRFGQSASVVAVLSSLFLFDLIFVPPRWSLNPTNTQHVFTLIVMLLVGLLISRLVAQARTQALVADERSRREQALNELARELAVARTPDAIAVGLTKAVRSTFGASGVLLLPDESGRLRDTEGFCRGLLGDTSNRLARGGVGAELHEAQKTFDRGEITGAGLHNASQPRALYVPLRGAAGSLGVLAIHPGQSGLHNPQEHDLLKAIANQAALALERSIFEHKSANAVVEVETERLRSTLLSGISHDFRTPLTTIVGAATSLQQQDKLLDTSRRSALTQSILDEARRMHALVSDLLDLTRLEDGGVQPAYEWCPADELVEEARKALATRLKTHILLIQVPPDAVVWCDPRLLVQVLTNLLDNALRYTPPGSTIVVAVDVMKEYWRLTVSDNGPGLPVGHERDVFKKFYRGRPEPAGAGTGLGLAISAAAVRLHHGTIEGVTRDGASFEIRLPQPERHAPPMDEVA